MLAFKFENPDLNKDYQKYFRIRIRHWSFDDYVDEYEKATITFTEQCTKEHFD